MKSILMRTAMKLGRSDGSATPRLAPRRLRRAGPPSRWRDSRGSAVVESALIILFVFTVLVGIMEMARFMSVQQTLTDAAREGARLAVTPLAGTNTLAGDGAVNGYVQDFLDSNGLSSANVSIDRNVAPGPGDDLFTVVRVEMPYQVLTLSWFDALEVTVVGSSRMRNETSP